jgi:hypothetical protein
MFRVTTLNLSADTTQAGTALGHSEVGELSREQFIALLEQFRRLDPVLNQEADPQVVVVGRAGRFLVRTGREKLFLYHARDAIEPYAELTAAEIADQLDRSTVTAPPFSTAPAPEPPAPAAPHRGIAVAILVVGLLLNGYTLYSVFYTDSVTEKPVVTLLTDAKELAARRNEVVGTFATGDQPGDRAIHVQPDGRIRFFEIGSKDSVTNNTDTYQVGRHAKNFCLMTRESGVVDIGAPDTLVYFRDAYRRTK